jgi:hypothetical protein
LEIKKQSSFLVLVGQEHTVTRGIENIFVLGMCSEQMRILCTVGFKLTVINYAKKYSNKTAKRHFGPPHVKREVTEEHILQTGLT